MLPAGLTAGGEGEALGRLRWRGGEEKENT